jgi:quercetin dioxygenase-like cupin family protein
MWCLLKILHPISEMPIQEIKMAGNFGIDIALRYAVLACLVWVASATSAWAQATSRSCAEGSDEHPGPACLMAHQPLGKLSGRVVYWRLYTYSDLATATREQPPGAVLAVAFGRVWLFIVGSQDFIPKHGQRVAEVGPIPIDRDTVYSAEFLKSTFSPGMEAPVHVHSGPEAFYAISGDTCLETPDGVQRGKGPGNSLLVRAGPPMLLTAPGPEPRKGFAMILHDSSLAPTTLVNTWMPKGLCRAQASSDHENR